MKYNHSLKYLSEKVYPGNKILFLTDKVCVKNSYSHYTIICDQLIICLQVDESAVSVFDYSTCNFKYGVDNHKTHSVILSKNDKLCKFNFYANKGIFSESKIIKMTNKFNKMKAFL